MTNEHAARSWNVAFGRSSLSPLIFTVKPGFREAVWRALVDVGVPVDADWRPYGLSGRYNYSQAGLLDGFLFQLDWHSYTGKPRLPNGMWVVGVRPLYLLIQLLGLTPPPRPLRGVPPWDTSADLLAEARAQVAEDGNTYWWLVTEPGELTAAAIEAFGEAADPGLEARTEAEGEWGEAGFSVADSRRYRRAKVSLDEARQWKSIECTSEDAAWFVYKGYSLDTIRRLHEAGVPYHSMRLDAQRFSLERVLELVEAGCEHWRATDYLYGGYGPDGFLALQRTGISASEAAWFAFRKYPVEEALAWHALGVGSSDAGFLRARGVTPEEMRSLLGRGITVDMIRAATQRKLKALRRPATPAER